MQFVSHQTSTNMLQTKTTHYQKLETNKQVQAYAYRAGVRKHNTSFAKKQTQQTQ